jgi:hypothetical protein
MSKSDEKLREELNSGGVKTSGKPKPKRGADVKADATEKVARPRIPAGSKPSEVLALHITEPSALYEACKLTKNDEPSKSAFNAFAKTIDGLAKKVGEKAVNLIRHQSSPDNVQVYTRIGLDHLLDQGTMTSASLRGVYSAKYKPGTCSAQSNQIMQLFPALGIASREDKSTLKLNRDSSIVAAYRKARK